MQLSSELEEHTEIDDVYLTEDGYYIDVICDYLGRPIIGITVDGEIEWYKGIPTPIKEKLDEINTTLDTHTSDIEDLQDVDLELQDKVIEFVDNGYYMYAITDADKKPLFGITVDGDIEWYRGIPQPIQEKIDEIQTETYDGGYVEAITDADDRFLYGVTVEGAFHAAKYDFDENNVSDLMEALKSADTKIESPVDWSEATELDIPEPRCAILNLITSYGFPTAKFVDHNDWIEFWDCNGNYFKKRAITNAQGNSSLGFVKKNLAMDFCNSAKDDGTWDGDDTFKLKIGDWVPQDSFHLKAYYTDYFRGVAVITYKLFDEVMLSRPIEENRPWKKMLVDYDGIHTYPQTFGGEDDGTLELDGGAKNHPDGFPCKVFVNGEFYGLYSFQIKKHRDNYHQSKSEAKHIHLDGSITTTTLLNNTIDWGNGDITNGGTIQWEVRNPKKLYLMDGTKYDADFNIGEFMDTTSEYYDSSNKDHVRSNKVKTYIKNLSQAMPTINAARTTWNSNKTEANANAVKELFETYFDVDNWIDYLIVSDIVRNDDGFAKNWQWNTYDGVKWFVNIYDVDMSFGGDFRGTWIRSPLAGHINTNILLPPYYVITFYKERLEARYAELRNLGIIDVEHITRMLSDWPNRYGGPDAFDKEWERWPDCPCHRDTVLNDGWERADNVRYETINATGVSLYNNTITYSSGTEVAWCVEAAYSTASPKAYSATAKPHMGVYKFRATGSVAAGVEPVRLWGYYDSIYRVKRWLETSISNMDTVYNYTPNN